MQYKHVFATLLLVVSPSFAHNHHSHCRCRPSDKCWPSPTQWQALNASINGNLVAVRPVASVCHEPSFDATACEAVVKISNDSSWRISEPGAVQWLNWEARPATNESCYATSSRNIPCGQGRISLFSAAVRKTEDIQAVVRFAERHNLRLAIKNSGHCYLGRSSAPESLQIATHNMKDLKFTDNFIPAAGCAKDKEHIKSYGPAVTIGAGVVLKQLYTAVAERDLTVVAGLAHTVGPAGGYIQGGGHSPLGTWKGMASDNALEFTVVTAEGKLVVANEHQNSDLFWALRGGGGGTFGVVVSVTVRTFPEVPAFVASFTVATTNMTGFREVVRQFHTQLPRINDEGASGYYFLTAGPDNTSLSSLNTALVFANQTDEARLNGVLAPLITSFVEQVGNSSVTYLPTLSPQTKYFFQTALAGDSDTTGTFSRIGSRLISHEFLSTEEGPTRLTDAIFTMASYTSGGSMTGHIVAGGQVARNTLDTALNPAWRRTVTHIAFGQGWNTNTTWAEQKALEDGITNVLLPILKALEPDMGAYLNEANPDEVDWQQSFWGENYGKLYKIKQRWDPDGLFITRRGVGSEDWDDNGLCRVHHHRRSEF